MCYSNIPETKKDGQLQNTHVGITKDWGHSLLLKAA